MLHRAQHLPINDVIEQARQIVALACMETNVA
jgi:hypothetical protein